MFFSERELMTTSGKILRRSSQGNPSVGGLNQRVLEKMYRFWLCENCQGQSCKAFIGLTIGAKMIGGGRPLLPEILSQSDRVGAKFERAAIIPKRYEIGCQLLLITNRK